MVVPAEFVTSPSGPISSGEWGEGIFRRRMGTLRVVTACSGWFVPGGRFVLAAVDVDHILRI